jgi:hypothetical protein
MGPACMREWHAAHAVHSAMYSSPEDFVVWKGDAERPPACSSEGCANDTRTTRTTAAERTSPATTARSVCSAVPTAGRVAGVPWLPAVVDVAIVAGIGSPTKAVSPHTQLAQLLAAID